MYAIRSYYDNDENETRGDMQAADVDANAAKPLDGFEFTVEDLKAALRENGDDFESFGNPPKKGIWV